MAGDENAQQLSAQPILRVKVPNASIMSKLGRTLFGPKAPDLNREGDDCCEAALGRPNARQQPAVSELIRTGTSFTNV